MSVEISYGKVGSYVGISGGSGYGNLEGYPLVYDKVGRVDMAAGDLMMDADEAEVAEETQ